MAIGSCRITRPLRRLWEGGDIELINFEKHRWFTHTASAARQFVDVLDGRTRIPMELRAAALETDLEFRENMASAIGGVDAVFVEVSTLKQHRVDGIELNAHKIYGIVAETGLPPGPVLSGDTSRLPDDHVLKRMAVVRAGAEEVAADLLAIRARYAVPVVLVDHLYSELSDGTAVPERARLTGILSEIGAEHGFTVYSTKELILEYGIEVALQDQNHYRLNFEPLVSGKFMRLIRETLG